MSESLQQERESPWALTLTERVPEAFEIPPSDFFWPISEEEQPGDSHVFLHEVVFLIERRGSVARSTGKLLRRVSERKKKNNDKTKSRKSQTITWPQENKHSQGIFHGGLIEGIVNF